MSVIIGADIVPTRSNIEYFEKARAEKLIGKELNSLLEKSDFNIFNLEVPLTDVQSPIKKEGPNLIASRGCIAGLKELNVNLLTLANNHIMDQGIQGFKSTINVLRQSGIAYVGSGWNIQEARKPFYFDSKGIKYGVYACTEHEFSIANEKQPGANPFDPLESLDHVANIKNHCDFLIVLYHGGKEYYRYPSPYLQKVCRRLIEKGADLVVCQHSHCVGCMEEYRSGTIVYGQGNFIFDNNDNDSWRTSLLVNINDHGKLEYIPLKKEGEFVRLAPEKDSYNILKGFRERSKEILEPEFIEKRYRLFAKESCNGYMLFFSGKKSSYIFKIFNKITKNHLQSFYAQRYLDKHRTGLRNYIECEAHRELVLKGIEQE